MALNPLIALQAGQSVPDVGQTFSNVLTNINALDAIKQARADAPLRARLLEAQTAQQEAAVPTAQQQLNEADKRKISSVATGARQIIPDLQAGNIDRVMSTLNRRSESLIEAGVDNSDTIEAIQLAQTNPAELLRVANNAIALDAQISGFGQRGAGLKQFAPVTLVNEGTGEKITAIPTADPKTGAARLEPASFPEGFRIATETPEEKRQADVLAAEQKKAREVTGKTRAERQAISIDNGLVAADGMANLKRAEELLDLVETGGVDAVSVRAKQIFGVEGADEAELSNRLSKAVLSQLKATFGAAFTANEGARLERIEAGLGKSTEGNRRLIKQTIKLVDRAARRGIKAAESAGDPEAAQDIREALEFRLGDSAQSGRAVIRFNRQGQRIE